MVVLYYLYFRICGASLTSALLFLRSTNIFLCTLNAITYIVGIRIRYHYLKLEKEQEERRSAARMRLALGAGYMFLKWLRNKSKERDY
ncbi:unnamed protein product [Trichobilharzia szidati]|nr:unnamed protein product [Trichobilharzia szidati]